MRVIAGLFRSRRLATLAGAKTRPSSDQLRETLFNVLGEAVRESLFADCYAGSGAVGIEAVSRGAAFVYFLENHRPAIKVIERNLASLAISSGTEIFPLDVCTALRQLREQGIRLDLVFVDPPYQSREEYQRSLQLLGEGQLVRSTGRVIVEHSRRQPLADRYGALQCDRHLTHGDSVLSFYRLL